MSDKITVLHILTDQKYESQDILRKLEQGERFETLARDYSMCGSAKEGGSLGEFGRGKMVAPFENAAFALEVGQISPITQTQFGYHLIKRIK